MQTSIGYRPTRLSTAWLLLLALAAGNPLQASTPGAMSYATNGAGALHQAIGGNGVACVAAEFTALWNPALLGLHDRRQLTLEHGEWFAGELKKDIVELTLPTGSSRAYAVNVLRTSVRDIPLTSRLEQTGDLSADNRPLVDSRINSGQWQAVFAAGTRLRTGLRLGGSIKLIYEDIADLQAWGLGVDVGLWYQWRRLALGCRLRDALTTRLFWNTGLRETVLPDLALGAGWTQPLWLTELSLFTTISRDLNGANYNDAGDEIALEWRSGLLCRLGHWAHLAAGWDGSRLSGGAGARYKAFGVNYALFRQQVLGVTHLVTLTADLRQLLP